MTAVTTHPVTQAALPLLRKSGNPIVVTDSSARRAFRPIHGACTLPLAMDPKEEIPPVDPGTVLAFDNAVEKLRVTLADQRALDTKAATMIALLGGAVAAYAVVVTTTLECVVGGLLLFAAVVTALLAYRITAFGDAPAGRLRRVPRLPA